MPVEKRRELLRRVAFVYSAALGVAFILHEALGINSVVGNRIGFCLAVRPTAPGTQRRLWIPATTGVERSDVEAMAGGPSCTHLRADRLEFLGLCYPTSNSG